MRLQECASCWNIYWGSDENCSGIVVLWVHCPSYFGKLCKIFRLNLRVISSGLYCRVVGKTEPTFWRDMSPHLQRQGIIRLVKLVSALDLMPSQRLLWRVPSSVMWSHPIR
jgi:hypothetical protein